MPIPYQPTINLILSKNGSFHLFGIAYIYNIGRMVFFVTLWRFIFSISEFFCPCMCSIAVNFVRYQNKEMIQPRRINGIYRVSPCIHVKIKTTCLAYGLRTVVTA